MPKYKLCDFEENRYHDSYGYIVYWDSELKKLDRVMNWTTAFASCGFDDSQYLDPTLEIVNEAVEFFAKILFRQRRRDVLNGHYYPEQVKVDETVVFKRDYKGKVKAKKGDTGKVFWCGKGDTGKVFWCGKGDTGKVFWCGIDRYKTRPYSRVVWYAAGIELADGRKVFVSTDVLHYNGRPVENRSESRAIAKNKAKGCQFRSLWYGGWDTYNWALDLLKFNCAK